MRNEKGTGRKGEKNALKGVLEAFWAGREKEFLTGRIYRKPRETCPVLHILSLPFQSRSALRDRNCALSVGSMGRQRILASCEGKAGMSRAKEGDCRW